MSLNKAILMGRLTAEPELRRTPSGTSVTSFTLAIDRPKYKDKDKETDFIDCVAWSHTAEFIAKWFSKGQLMAVSGRLQVRNWEDKQGQKRKSVEVIVDEAHFAESKKDRPQKQERLPFDLGAGEFSEFDEDGDLPF